MGAPFVIAENTETGEIVRLMTCPLRQCGGTRSRPKYDYDRYGPVFEVLRSPFWKNPRVVDAMPETAK